MVRSGKKRYLITIQSRSVVTDSRWGDNGETWTTFATLWAEVNPKPKKSTETDNQGVESRNGYEFKTRFLAGVTPEMRIQYRGRTCDIFSVTNVGELDEELQIEALEHPQAS